METLWPKKQLPNFFQLEDFRVKQPLTPTHYSICCSISLSILYLHSLPLTK